MDNKEYLDEIFALPVNLKSVGTVSGFELYSSDSLKDKFIESLEKSNYAGIFKGIRTLVNNGTIVPAFGTRNLFRFIMVKKPKFLTHDDEVTYVAFVDFDIGRKEIVHILLKSYHSYSSHLEELPKLTHYYNTDSSNFYRYPYKVDTGVVPFPEYYLSKA